MCRVMRLNRPALRWLALDGDADYLTPWLRALIASNGGDGNGVAAIYADEKVNWSKGLDLSPQQLTEWLLDEYFQGATRFLFHTRRASIGKVSSVNCHPFIVGRTVLIHNGHDDDLIKVARKIGYKEYDMPDSHAAAWLADWLGPAILENFSGTFIGFHRGKPFTALGPGHWPLQEIKVGKQHGLIHCSERPWHLQDNCYAAKNLRRQMDTTYSVIRDDVPSISTGDTVTISEKEKTVTYYEHTDGTWDTVPDTGCFAEAADNSGQGSKYVWRDNAWVLAPLRNGAIKKAKITQTLSYAALGLSYEDWLADREYLLQQDVAKWHQHEKERVNYPDLKTIKEYLDEMEQVNE